MSKINEPAKPLWLNLKKEYIDDNFEALLPYLINCKNEAMKDSFYNTTISLLMERASDLLSNIAEAPVYQETPPTDVLTFNIRLLALSLYMAVEINPENNQPSRFPDHIELFTALTLELHKLLPKESETLIKLVSKAITHNKITNTGFSIQLISNFMPEIFIHRLSTLTTFADPIKNKKLLEQNGRVWLDSEGLAITATGETNEYESTTTLPRSLDTNAGFWLGTKPTEKLKKSDSADLVAMSEFLAKFNQRQNAPLKQDSNKRKISYFKGDKTVVTVTGFGEEDDGTIYVRTTDPTYKTLEGKIHFSKPILVFYYSNKFYKYLKKGDYLPVTVVDEANGLFSFEDQFIEFQVEDTRQNYGTEYTFYAILSSRSGKYFNWINERGVWIVTLAEDYYQPGDIALLQVEMYCFGTKYGRINARIVERVLPEEEFSEAAVRKDCFSAFLEQVPEPDIEETSTQTYGTLSTTLLGLLSRSLYMHQWTLLSPAERFRFLANAMALSVVLDDELSCSYINFAMTYLRALVRFASGQSLNDIVMNPDSRFADTYPVKLRMAVIDILREYGNPEYSQKLADYISQEESDMQLISKLARLVQASNSIQESLTSASVNVIKREIIRSLSIETEETAQLEAEDRIYLGSEGQTVEFKTSIVFPPDNNMIANQQLQTQNVFRAICAFLNSMIGGTLYIGVDDNGYVSGLDADRKYLNCTSFDTYSRLHIQDPLIKAFGLDVMTYIHIDSAYDDQVAVIRVEPHPFRVVELNNTAYLRVDRESREMPESVRKELAMKKLTADRNLASKIMQLQHAEFKQQCAILKDVVSSDEKETSDFLVEPYTVLKDHGVVFCYDHNSEKCLAINLASIRYVELTSTPWSNVSRHRQFEIDAFHTIGTADNKPFSVSLELDQTARSLMTEEFPLTKKDIQQYKGNSSVWYYNGKVQQLEGIGRFLIGLADHIRIIEGEELKQYLRNYITTHLAQYTN